MIQSSNQKKNKESKDTKSALNIPKSEQIFDSLTDGQSFEQSSEIGMESTMELSGWLKQMNLKVVKASSSSVFSRFQEHPKQKLTSSLGEVETETANLNKHFRSLNGFGIKTINNKFSQSKKNFYSKKQSSQKVKKMDSKVKENSQINQETFREEGALLSGRATFGYISKKSIKEPEVVELSLSKNSFRDLSNTARFPSSETSENWSSGETQTITLDSSSSSETSTDGWESHTDSSDLYSFIELKSVRNIVKSCILNRPINDSNPSITFGNHDGIKPGDFEVVSRFTSSINQVCQQGAGTEKVLKRRKEEEKGNQKEEQRKSKWTDSHLCEELGSEVMTGSVLGRIEEMIKYAEERDLADLSYNELSSLFPPQKSSNIFFDQNDQKALSQQDFARLVNLANKFKNYRKDSSNLF